jgi:hypothetical protein
VYRLEQAGPVPSQARGRQHPQRAREHRCLVGENVAEHVLGQDHVEPCRLRYELHGGIVDQQVLELDLGVVARDAGHRLTP